MPLWFPFDLFIYFLLLFLNYLFGVSQGNLRFFFFFFFLISLLVADLSSRSQPCLLSAWEGIVCSHPLAKPIVSSLKPLSTVPTPNFCFLIR
jgi:hypothetical protein